MKQILDNIPKAIALLSFAILALTVVHEWGYFWVVGTHFQTVASAYDYLSNSILWLPQNLLIILVAFVVEMAFIGYFRRSSADEDKPELGIKAKNEKHKKIRKHIAQLASGACVLSAAVMLLTYFLAPPFLVFPYMLSAAFFIWLYISLRCSRLRNIYIN